MAEEAHLEKKLKRKIKERGGWCLKWISPNTTGVPDDIVFPGDGSVYLVEVKAPGKGLRPLQKIVHSRLKKLGLNVRVLSSDSDIEKFIDEIYPPRVSDDSH